MRGRVASKMKRNEKEKDYKFIFFFPASYRGTLFFLSTTLCDLLCVRRTRACLQILQDVAASRLFCVLSPRDVRLFL